MVDDGPTSSDSASSVADEISGLPIAPRRAAFELLAYLLTVFVLITLNFVLPRVLPGDHHGQAAVDVVAARYGTHHCGRHGR